MGLFDIFKRKKKKEKEESSTEEEKPKEEVSVHDLAAFLEKKKEASHEGEQEVLENIRKRIQDATEELEQKVAKIEEIDASSKTKDERISSIVQQNIDLSLIHI